MKYYFCFFSCFKNVKTLAVLNSRLEGHTGIGSGLQLAGSCPKIKAVLARRRSWHTAKDQEGLTTLSGHSE